MVPHTRCRAEAVGSGDRTAPWTDPRPLTQALWRRGPFGDEWQELSRLIDQCSLAVNRRAQGRMRVRSHLPDRCRNQSLNGGRAPARCSSAARRCRKGRLSCWASSSSFCSGSSIGRWRGPTPHSSTGRRQVPPQPRTARAHRPRSGASGEDCGDGVPDPRAGAQRHFRRHRWPPASAHVH